MKFDLNKISEAAARVLKPADVTQLMEMLRDMAPDEKEEKAPAVKKQFVVLLSDPEGVMPKTDLVAWVLQLPEDEAVQSVQERIHNVAYTFNATKRGQLLPVQTVAECIENVKAGAFKEHDLWVKTKTPVLVLRTSNEIPQTPGLFGDGERGTFTKGQS